MTGSSATSCNYPETDKFVSDVFESCMENVVRPSRDRATPVVNFKTPEDLTRTIDFSLSKEGTGHDKLLELCKKVMENSVLTGHPRFFNQMYGGSDMYGFAGNIIVDVLNTNGHTFEIAPAFSVAEVELIKHMQKLLNYSGDGTFCPGGSYCGLLAMSAARAKKFPTCKEKGFYSLPKMVVLCSEQAHYSAQKNAILLGVGLDNCISVKCDKRGKMIPVDLETKIDDVKSQGSVPFMVIATAGTTVLGAFDPFDAIADICSRHHIWLHVDGAWGGSALLSRKHRHLCNGAERADSFAWNPHKLMHAPIQSSVLLFKERNMLEKSHAREVNYLFQNDKPYDQTYDLGRNLLQCGRSCDAFKLWLIWKAIGDHGLEERIDRSFDDAKYFLNRISERPHYRLHLKEIECPNVCFWYVPPSMRGEPEDEQFYVKLGKLVPIIKLRMQRSGRLLVGYSPVGNTPTFFRMVFVNDNVTHEDLDFVLDEIEREAADL